jgi:hypothetical protein
LMILGVDLEYVFVSFAFRELDTSVHPMFH